VNIALRPASVVGFVAAAVLTLAEWTFFAALFGSDAARAQTGVKSVRVSPVESVHTLPATVVTAPRLH
jgi:hypothetical protein